MIPVRPGEERILGESVFPDLTSIDQPVDIVVIFRRSEHAGAVVDEALTMAEKPRAIWMQFGVIDADARDRAEAAGVRTFMDQCIKVDHANALGR